MSSIPVQLPLFPERICTKCGLSKPLEEFYVKIKQTGRRFSWCKACHCAITNAKYVKKGRKPYVLPEEKACTQCGRVLPITAFEPRSDQPGHRRPECRACHSRRGSAHYAAHRERHQAWGRAYYQANKERVLLRLRLCRLKKIDAYKAAAKLWKRNNKHLVNASTHRRRYALKHSLGMWTPDEWERIKGGIPWLQHRFESPGPLPQLQQQEAPQGA
jgi:hypothetical protein